MKIIAPSILSANFLTLEQEILSLNPAQDIWIHLDVMDAHFVPNLTFGKVVIKDLEKITPHPLDAHFMVDDPAFFIEQFKDTGLHNFTFHWEATKHHDSLVQKARQYYPSVGISLNPSTPVSSIPAYLWAKIDLVLIMSVNPGFGGQSFITGTIDKIKEISALKQKYNPKLKIQIDGGVSDKNANDLWQAGATHLVAGSYIFSQTPDLYLKQIENLRS